MSLKNLSVFKQKPSPRSPYAFCVITCVEHVWKWVRVKSEHLCATRQQRLRFRARRQRRRRRRRRQRQRRFRSKCRKIGVRELISSHTECVHKNFTTLPDTQTGTVPARCAQSDEYMHGGFVLCALRAGLAKNANAEKLLCVRFFNYAPQFKALCVKRST